MATKEQTARLTVKHGKSVGKRFTLKADSTTLGADPNCGIVVKGTYVSPEHAVISLREDGMWIITNKSVNRTLVNQVAIDTRALETGDQVQIGAETLFEFEIPLQKEKKKRVKEEKGEDTEGKKPSLLKRPIVLAGAGAYGLIMIGIVVLLAGISSGDEDDVILSPEAAREAMMSSKSFMTSQEFIAASSKQPTIQANMELSDSASRFHQLTMAYGSGTTDSTSELVEEILAEAREHLFRAWHYEGRGQWFLAIEQYNEIMTIIPDIRVPLTQFAAYRIDLLNDLPEE